MALVFALVSPVFLAAPFAPVPEPLQKGCLFQKSLKEVVQQGSHEVSSQHRMHPCLLGLRVYAHLALTFLGTTGKNRGEHVPGIC